MAPHGAEAWVGLDSHVEGIRKRLKMSHPFDLIVGFVDSDGAIAD